MIFVGRDIEGRFVKKHYMRQTIEHGGDGIVSKKCGTVFYGLFGRLSERSSKGKPQKNNYAYIQVSLHILFKRILPELVSSGIEFVKLLEKATTDNLSKTLAISLINKIFYSYKQELRYSAGKPQGEQNFAEPLALDRFILLPAGCK